MRVYGFIQQTYTMSTYYEQVIMSFIEKYDLYLDRILAV